MLLIHLGFPSLTIFKGQGKTAYPTFKICLLSCLLPRHLKINSDWDPVKILLIFQEFKKPEKKGLLHSVSKSAPENCNLSLKLLIACMHKYHSLFPIFCPILICVYYFPAQEAYKSIFWIKQRERKKKNPTKTFLMWLSPTINVGGGRGRRVSSVRLRTAKFKQGAERKNGNENTVIAKPFKAPFPHKFTI